jgi:hypothetical protein
MGFRYYRRKGLGNRLLDRRIELGLSAGRRGKRVFASYGCRDLGASVRLAKGLSYLFGRAR